MAGVSVGGLGSGLDINGLISQLVAAERAGPENRLTAKEAKATAQLSAFGSVKSAMESFNNRLTKLADATLYTKVSATSANTDLFTASADATAVPGTYSVEVEALATRHKIASDAFATAETAIGETGTLTVNSGTDSFNIAIDTADTIEEIRDAVNGSADNDSVTASIVIDQSDNAFLVFTAKDSGVANAITVSGITALDSMDSGLPANEKVAAADTTVKVDGFTATSSDTTVTGVIPGVTLTVKDAEDNATYELTVAKDTAAVKKEIEGFVNDYNSLRQTLNDLTQFNAEANTAGLLNGDSTVRGITAQLRTNLTEVVSSVDADFDTLAEIGITSSETDGTLSIESSKLDAALADNFDQIDNFFTDSDGIATTFAATVSVYLGSDGILQNRTDGLQSQIDRVTDQREALNRRIAVIEARFIEQFTALDTLLGELNNTSSFLGTQLANLPGATFKKD